MSIEGDLYYGSLELYQHEKLLWSMPGPLIGDLVAGIIIGIHAISNAWGLDGQFRVKVDDISIWINGYNYAIAEYIVAAEVEEIDFRDINIENDSIYLSITDYHFNSPIVFETFTVCKFASLEFIRGFISICNAFQVNFRDYTLYPFTHNNETGVTTYYNIVL